MYIFGLVFIFINPLSFYVSDSPIHTTHATLQLLEKNQKKTLIFNILLKKIVLHSLETSQQQTETLTNLVIKKPPFGGLYFVARIKPYNNFLPFQRYKQS